jgi:hypothetical protein
VLCSAISIRRSPEQTNQWIDVLLIEADFTHMVLLRFGLRLWQDSFGLAAVDESQLIDPRRAPADSWVLLESLTIL